jgi:hypothetical protein
MSRRTIEQEVQDGRLVAVDIQGVQAIRDLYMITDPQRLPTRVARAFLNALADNSA